MYASVGAIISVLTGISSNAHGYRESYNMSTKEIPRVSQILKHVDHGYATGIYFFTAFKLCPRVLNPIKKSRKRALMIHKFYFRGLMGMSYTRAKIFCPPRDI